MPLGVSSLQQGAFECAQALFEEALVRLQYSSSRWFMSHPFMGIAAVAAAREQLMRTARLMGVAKALNDATRTPPIPAIQSQHDQLVSAVRAQLGEDAFGSACAEGQALTIEQAIAYALKGEDEAPRAELPTTPPHLSE